MKTIFNMSIHKKCFCILLLSYISLAYMHAQIEKGSIFLGAYAKGDITPSGADNTFASFNMDIQAAYYLHKKLALGLSLPLGYQTSEIIKNNNYTYQFGVLPFIQYHPFADTGKFKFFIWLETGLLSTKAAGFVIRQTSINYEKRNEASWAIGGGLGMNYFLSKSVAFTVSVKAQDTYKLSGNLFKNYPLLSLNIGLRFYFKPF